MKKVLISILIVLLIVLAYFAMFNGLSFGKVNILSIEQIIEADNNLTNDIEETNSLLKKDYPGKKEELSQNVDELLQSKKEYFKLAKTSTEKEISKANTEETYLREYLWVRVGRHATSNGVYLKMDVNTGNTGEDNLKNLAFTVQGNYIPIIQFISSLEDDDKLGFKIEDFKMVKGAVNLIATFNVRNVRIKSESLSNTSENDNVLTNSIDQENENNEENENNQENQPINSNQELKSIPNETSQNLNDSEVEQ